MKVDAGSTNVSVYYYIVQDASATSPGEPVTGLLFSDIETGGSASYARQGAARVDLTLITLASASATHADGGFILVDDTNMPGLYRCDYPDAAFASGIDQVFLQIVVASAKNAVAAPILVDIEASIAQTANNDTKLTTLLARIIGTLESGSHNPASAAEIATLNDWIDGNRLDLILDARMAEASINTTAGAIDNVTLAATTTALTNVINAASVVASVSGNVGGSVASVTAAVTVGTINANTITAASIAASALDGKGDWNINKTGYSLTITPPTAVENRQEMDSNSVDLNSLLSGQSTINTNVLAIPTAVQNRQEMDSNSIDLNTIITQIGTAGAGLTDLGGMSTGMKAEVLTEVVKLLVTQMTESYAADGVAPTLTQALMLIQQVLTEFAFTGTSNTVKKLDGASTAAVMTLDDGTNPTSSTRTS